MNYNKIGFQALQLVQDVGAYIVYEGRKFDRQKVEFKGVHDLVSFVDKTAEERLVEGLSQLIPGAGFIVEEGSAAHSNEDYIWIVDPLDGTTNFIHGVFPHAISVALHHQQQPVLGIVFEMGKQELFYAWEGSAVFCNQQMIQVSPSKALDEALVATGLPVNDFSRLPEHMKTIEAVVRKSNGVRRHGSAATDLAYVAAGRFCGFFEYGLSPWDVAAGAYLVQRAGGKVSDYSGGQNYHFGREMLAGTPAVYQELLNLLQTNS